MLVRLLNVQEVAEAYWVTPTFVRAAMGSGACRRVEGKRGAAG